MIIKIKNVLKLDLKVLTSTINIRQVDKTLSQ